MQVEVWLKQGLFLIPAQLGLCMGLVMRSKVKGKDTWQACFFDTFPVTVHY